LGGEVSAVRGGGGKGKNGTSRNRLRTYRTSMVERMIKERGFRKKLKLSYSAIFKRAILEKNGDMQLPGLRGNGG